MKDLKTIPLTQEDIDLITFALRRLKKDAAFSNLRDDAAELIKYIERENKNKS